VKVAFISDTHSNLEALQAVMEQIEKMRVERVFCCGDIVGYNANPNEVIELLVSKNVDCVKGNHDWAVVNQNTSWFSPLPADAIKWTIEQITSNSKAFLQALPERKHAMVGDKRVFFVHGSPDDPLFEYVFEDTPNQIFEEWLKRNSCDILVMGHTHLPFIAKLEGKLVINPGSVGQPRDDIPHSAFAYLDTDRMSASIIRVPYDIETAASKVRAAGLPELFAERLRKGR